MNPRRASHGRSLFNLIILTMAPVLSASAQAQPAQNGDQCNPVGWEWLVTPMELAADWRAALPRGETSAVHWAFAVEGEVLTVDLCMPRSFTENEYRGVAFDGAGRRHLLKSGTSAVTDQTYRVACDIERGGVPLESLRRIGIEVLTPAGRKARAADAGRRAAAIGVPVLPMPQIGERYSFRLKTVGGCEIESDALRGKVVLLDGWATWCGPCMEKMGALRAFYEAHRSEGFEIVGLNHDATLSRATAAIEKQALPWPQVVAPVDFEERTLWYESCGSSSLPWLVVIDRTGVVRAKCRPEELCAKILPLLKTPAAVDATAAAAPPPKP